LILSKDLSGIYILEATKKPSILCYLFHFSYSLYFDMYV
jgi:hypothetical protein